MAKRIANTNLAVFTNSDAPVTVSTDGSALYNPSGPMGWGWYNHDTGTHDAGGASNGTNQIGELCAVLEALRAHHNASAITIESDSNYAINCSSTWLKNWKRNGWRNSKKQRISNYEIIRAIDEEIESRPGTVRFVWVKGHAGEKYNEIVDKLAHGYSSAIQAGKATGRMPFEGWQVLATSPYARGLQIPPAVKQRLETDATAGSAAPAAQAAQRAPAASTTASRRTTAARGQLSLF